LTEAFIFIPLIMNYRVYTPHALLLPYVKCYWSLEADSRAMATAERIFPDGCVELLFHYGDRFRKYTGPQQSILQPRSFIHGQIRSYIELEATGAAGMFGVRFQPMGLQAFVLMDALELSGLNVETEQVWGKAGDELSDRMLNASCGTERAQIVDAFLLRNLRGNMHSIHMLSWCVQQIQHSAGSITVDTLAREVNVGRRQLERRFMAGVGLSPKILSRIIRFQNVLQLIGQNRINSLTALAYEGGYYDQPHFIRDFREFTGMSPRTYFSADLELARSLSS